MKCVKAIKTYIVSNQKSGNKQAIENLGNHKSVPKGNKTHVNTVHQRIRKKTTKNKLMRKHQNSTRVQRAKCMKTTTYYKLIPV